MKYVFRYVLPAVFLIAGIAYAALAVAQGAGGRIVAGVVVAAAGVALFFVMRVTTKDQN
jgi:hypothetical protein